jgi:hypothetical protein
MAPNKYTDQYTFRHYYIPERMRDSIKLYIEKGIHPGSFLSAIIRNDLRGACESADDENLQNIPAYIYYFYNYAPISCWGGPKSMKGHMERKAKERET